MRDTPCCAREPNLELQLAAETKLTCTVVVRERRSRTMNQHTRRLRPPTIESHSIAKSSLSTTLGRLATPTLSPTKRLVCRCTKMMSRQQQSSTTTSSSSSSLLNINNNVRNRNAAAAVIQPSVESILFSPIVTEHDEDVICLSRRPAAESSSSSACSSGPGRPHKSGHSSLSKWVPFALLIVTTLFMLQIADACSSRSTPKPRPPSPTTRPNITFQTYACPESYARWYCLNGATCFSVRIGESILYNCECSAGYVGQRCEFKDLEGSYLPSRHERVFVGIEIEKASLAVGAAIEKVSLAGIATVVFLIVAFVFMLFFTHIRHRRTQRKIASQQQDQHQQRHTHSASPSLMSIDQNSSFVASSRSNSCSSLSASSTVSMPAFVQASVVPGRAQPLICNDYVRRDYCRFPQLALTLQNDLDVDYGYHHGRPTNTIHIVTKPLETRF